MVGWKVTRLVSVPKPEVWRVLLAIAITDCYFARHLARSRAFSFCRSAGRLPLLWAIRSAICCCAPLPNHALHPWPYLRCWKQRFGRSAHVPDRQAAQPAGHVHVNASACAIGVCRQPRIWPSCDRRSALYAGYGSSLNPNRTNHRRTRRHPPRRLPHGRLFLLVVHC